MIVKRLEVMFDDIFSESPPSRKPDFPPTFGVHPDDIDLMRFLDIKKYNAMVAGGAALCWYGNMPVKDHDIDIWFNNSEDMASMNNHVRSRGTCTYSSERAETYELSFNSRSYRVQLIKPRGLDKSHKQIIDDFDITVCQIGTDGLRWLVSEDFMQDYLHKRLRFTKITPLTLRRITKYIVYGFQPDSQTIENIINDPQVKWTFESNDAGDMYDHVT